MSERPETRLVIVDETGRVYDRTGVKIEHTSQDGGKTLKIFVTPLPRDEEVKATQAHSDALGEAFAGLRNLLDMGDRLLRGR